MGAAALFDLLVPTRCCVCGGGERLLCAACDGSLRRLREPLCARCGAPTAWPVARCAECAGRRIPFRSARAAIAYEGAARTLVRAWKEDGLRSLSRALAELVSAVVPRPAVEAVVFVPGDQARLLWRGQNSAEALARPLAEAWALPVVTVLERARPVGRQRGLSRAARRQNVRGSFTATARPPPRVVLVDDVYTTGATVSAAAAELRRAGARAVDVVTLARAVRR